MKKVVSFSFGRSSACMVILAMEEFGPENVDVVSMDTGAEHDGSYEFARKFHAYIKEKYGKEIVYLRTDFDTPLGDGNGYEVVGIDGIGQDLKPFYEMICKYGVPYIGGMFCTDRMKLVPYKKYCDDKYGKGNYEAWLGIRFDEPLRFLGSELYGVLNKNFDLSLFDFACIYQSIKNDGPSSLRWWFEVIPSKDHNKIFKAARMLHEKLSGQRIAYMQEISDFEKQDVLDFWSEMPFDLEIEEWNGNCLFCPKKSNLKLAMAKLENINSYHDFLSMIYSDSVRIDKKTGVWHKMYRKKRSLEQVVAMFDGSTGDEIKTRIRGSKMTDSGSCSESCEPDLSKSELKLIYD